jgi:hypothetical protein
MMYSHWISNEFSIFFLPVSTYLVRLCDISSDDQVLDVACGTGNTVITAKRFTSDIKVRYIFYTRASGSSKRECNFGRSRQY